MLCFGSGPELPPSREGGRDLLSTQNGEAQLPLKGGVEGGEGERARSGGQLRAVDIAPRLPTVLGRTSLSRGPLGAGWASLGSSCQC